MNSQRTKQERLEARVNQDLKIRLQYAADLQGSSLSEFLLRSAEKAANEVISEHHTITLSVQDSIRFFDALLHPPKPNLRLKEANKQYKANVSSDAQ